MVDLIFFSSKTENYQMFSNFYPCKVKYRDEIFDSSEAAFQASKCWERVKDFIGISALESKQLGKRVKLRPDWEEVKDEIMYEVCLAKFCQNPDLRKTLLSTGETVLVEKTNWHDRYWGICTCGRCKSTGRNQLGKTLMRVRETLRRN